MRSKTTQSLATLALAAGLLAAPGAWAQGTATPAQPATPPVATPTPGMGMTPAAPGMGTATPSPGMGAAPAGTAAPRTDMPPTTTTPAAGANSFTEGQARSRIEAAGYTDVQGLAKDDQGVWRGKAMRNGASSDVGLDFQGNVVTGTGAAR